MHKILWKKYEQLEVVLGCFKTYAVTIKFKKSEFLKNKVSFLGYIISDKGIAVDPEKLKQFRILKCIRILNSYKGY